MKINNLEIKKIRQAIADYMASEGCGCCGNYDKHKRDAEVLGKLLKVPKFKDGSGYQFYKFKSGRMMKNEEKRKTP